MAGPPLPWGFLLQVSWGCPRRILTISELPDSVSLKTVWMTLILAILFDMPLQANFNYKVISAHIDYSNNEETYRIKQGTGPHSAFL